MPEHIFIGVAWPYANGPLHLGHLAGCYLPADIFARYHRMKGNHVLMVSGSDSHGTPITLKAEAEGIPPEDLVARFHSSFLDSWERMGIKFDWFTTTTTQNHQKVVHELFGKLYEQGSIYAGQMKVAYSPDFHRFLPDRYIEGTCPHCNSANARGDQCDNCGRTLDPVDLINPGYRRDNDIYPIEIKDTEHLFLSLRQFQDQLLEWARRQKHWRPNVRNFTLAFLQEGLRDRAISRDLEWGIPVPLSNFRDKRIYVWFEAVIGYLSASREWANSIGDPDAWRNFWQNPEARSYYFIGKDNIPFHTIIWPAILMGFGGLSLPYDVPANEFLTLEGYQLSTSRNWAVWVPDYLNRFPPDPLRYCLTASMPETSDADFSWSEYVRRNNDELVATYGNLVHRVLNLVHKNFGGTVPDPVTLEPIDRKLTLQADATLDIVAKSLEGCRFREAAHGFMNLARDTNRYLNIQAPWQQVKQDLPAAARTLYSALYVISVLKVLTYPFIPFSAQKLHELLGLKGKVEDYGWAVEMPKPGTNMPPPQPLFTKLDETVAGEQADKLG